MANRTKKPFSVTMSPALLKKLDEACAEYGMNRSAFISMAVAMYMKTDELKTMMAQAQELASVAKQLETDQQMSLYAQSIADKL